MKKNSPCSDRLPIGWVISGSLPPSVNSTSSCFKCVVEDSSLTDQIKSWYELEFYGAFKQVDARSRNKGLCGKKRSSKISSNIDFQIRIFCLG